MEDFQEWILDKSSAEWMIYAKRLSANDTGLTGGHQVGIYVPKEIISNAVPAISSRDIRNPEHSFTAKVSSHDYPEQNLRCIYYNGKFFDGTRNEHRITRWNSDVSDNPVQDPENTGALTFFAFHVPSEGVDADYLDVWVCKSLDEEEYIEKQIGEVIPGLWLFDRGDILFGGLAASLTKKETHVQLPDAWLRVFPGGEEIISFLSQNFSFRKTSPDDLIMERRETEYRLFRQIEELHVLDKVRHGFSSIDDFMQLANSVSNRRKSRSGRSLELHLESMFRQFGLTDFSTQCITEGRKKPDFIFPSSSAYHDQAFSSDRLRMLAVKTTCKDRWRQVLNEADRVDRIHLFTLQEGVSLHQFQEMEAENVQLVVPAPLHRKFPEQVRDRLWTLGTFIEETRRLY